MLPQQYCLRWRYHHSNLQAMFSQLLERQAFCDVTLACEGQTVKAHKIVLSACSTYFDTILSQYEEKDPILIMKDVKFVDIKCLVEFMYKGEINVEHCHLATLLKTAEELRIKGLAEVSWREEQITANNDQQPVHNGGAAGGIHSLSMESEPTSTNTSISSLNKRKRGRPPIDDYDQTFTSPKITHVSGNVIQDDGDDDHDDDNDDNCGGDVNFLSVNDTSSNVDENDEDDNDDDDDDNDDDDDDNDAAAAADIKGWEDENHHTDSEHQYKEEGYIPDETNSTGQQQSGTNNSLEQQWPDVIKMNDYLNTGRRQQFWEEPFTKRVMDAIKNKDLEMKTAAELLGVSYGTLYGRYRDAYGCLKHPYRVRDFWTEQGPADILAKLQRKEITLFRAAEQLNVTPQTLSNYLLSLHQGGDASTTTTTPHSASSTSYDDDDNDNSENDDHHILPDCPVETSLTTASLARNSLTATVLQNHPDITIIKKEKRDDKMPMSMVNNNSNHSVHNADA